MYLDHFGLRDFPFRIAPDPALMFWTADHHRAFDLLSRSVRENVAVTTILGEPGTGKTTLLQHFIAGLPRETSVGMISNYSSGLGGLDHWLHWAFDLRPEGVEDELRAAFEGYLLSRHHEGGRCLLIVDEAQNVSDDDIVALTNLTRIPAVPGPSMRLVLAGQPRLRRRLPTHARGTAADNFGFFQIGAMSPEDTQKYVHHRLAMSGCLEPIFDDEALAGIARLSGGIPRLVNVLCELLLTTSFGAGERRIDRAILDQLLRDTRETGMLDHLLGDPGQVTHLPAMPVRRRSMPGMAGHKQAVTSPPELTGTAEMQQAARTEGPRPSEALNLHHAPQAQPLTVSPALPTLPENTVILPIANPGRAKKRWAGMALVAVGATAAAIVVAVLPDHSPIRPDGSDAPAITLLHQTGNATPAAATIGPALGAPSSLIAAEIVDLRDLALSAGQQDPLKAAIGYARAALRGDTRAAYYLGQHFETGDGVPQNTALAAAWYTTAAETQRGARRALQNLIETTSLRPTAPPLLLLGTASADGAAEFFWAAPDDAPALYLVELTKSPELPPAQHGPFDTSAALLELTDADHLWRVVTIDAEGERLVASQWHLVDADRVETLASVPSQPLP